jgi:hypothetical protein
MYARIILEWGQALAEDINLKKIKIPILHFCCTLTTQICIVVVLKGGTNQVLMMIIIV